MPVHFLSEAQRTAYGHYAGEPSAEQLARYFHLDFHDRSVIAKRRGDENRLGFAVQLGTVRFLGTFLARPGDVPDVVVRYVASQLKIADPKALGHYPRREQTQHDHCAEIQRRYGYLPASDPGETFGLIRWLYARATFSPERPSVLFDRATARLVKRKILLPGVTVLERLIASVRSRAAARLWSRLSSLPGSEQRQALDALLIVPEGSRQSGLERLQRSPTIVSARALRQALDRLEEIELLQAGTFDLTGFPQGRIDGLARQANAANAQTMGRMPEDRRIATLLAFANRLERSACDDVLNLTELELLKLLTDADRDGKAKRKKTLQAFDQAAVLLRDAVVILLDPTHEDLKQLKEKVYAQISHDDLTEAAACVEQTARPHGRHHYEELVSRYRSVRQFLPKLLEIPFEGLPAGQQVLEGLAAIRVLEGRRRVDPEEIPGSLVTPAWEAMVFVEPGQVERRAFTFCVLEHLRGALRRRDVFVAKSSQWGDPRAQLIPSAEWSKARTTTCRMLGLSSAPGPFLEAIGQELDGAYRKTVARWSENEAVRIEATEGPDVLVLSGLEALEEPASLEKLREVMERMLPRTDLPELLLEVNAWTGFVEAFTHVSESRSRIPDHAKSICAALIADACNIGLAPLARKDHPALTRSRLSWIRQNYLRAETLTQANAALVDYQTTIPLAQQWGGGEVASADGLRFVVPVRTLNAGPNPRYFGTGRGVTYYNFTSDQFTGFHAIVVPGTIRDSLYVLEGLLEHETRLQISQVVTDTAGYSDLIFGLFRLLGFQFSPRLADLGSTRFWRMDRQANYGALDGLARSQISLRLIRGHWDDILRTTGSLAQGTVRASELIRALQRGGKPSSLARAIAELGRIAKTLHLLTYLDDETYRRRILRQINRGESRHSLARAVFFGKRGELRQSYKEGQEDQLGALGLVVNAIVLWNTRYMEAALAELRGGGEPIEEGDVRRLSPLVHHHVNFLGRYHFSLPLAVREGGLRGLRDPSFGLEAD